MSISEFSPPDEFDDYQVERPLGKGGMGRVYRGHDLLLDRPVAIKFIQDDFPTAEARQRFRVEAVALARLHHPNVMAVYRASHVAGRPYIVGELVKGQSLERLSKPIPWQRALEVALGLARGLGAVHHRGVLHRDLKPSNVILADDAERSVPSAVKLVDFGIAKLVSTAEPTAVPELATVPLPNLSLGETAPSFRDLEAGAQPTARDLASTAAPQDNSGGPPASRVSSNHLPALTQDGARLGTPLYMAPEIWNGEPATPRSDVYSFGVIVYELCAGQLPHDAETALTLGFQVTHKDAPPLCKVAPMVDAGFAAIIDRCLRRDPTLRYASAQELLADLERLAKRQGLRGRLIFVATATTLLILLLSQLGSKLTSWLDKRRLVTAKLAAAQTSWREANKKSEQADALRQQAFAAFDRLDSASGERLWAKARAMSQDSIVAYQHTTRLLDGAWHLDPQQPDVRRQLGDVLYEQAVLLDRDHQHDRRDEVWARLASYAGIDLTALQQRWDEPAQLFLASQPSSVVVRFQRYVGDAQKRLHLETVEPPRTTPLAGVTLRPGSYLLQLEAPGRTTVRLPLLLTRGQRFAQQIYLPTLAEIPEGYVYIPTGKVQFGTTWDDRVRLNIFGKNVPAHEVTTSPFLIGRTETTFADWLAFLDALPLEQKQKHRPRSAEGTAQGGRFSCEPTADGSWQIILGPTDAQNHVARLGEPIIYAGRDHRKTVRWERLPVVGIDMIDAQAYASWLRQTGKVPGARLCTEHEWERAARGADHRDYPHGDYLEADDINFDETYDRNVRGFGPDEVGAHPASRSPFGVDDLSGNVWEWVTSSIVAGQVVLRGGAYYYDSVTAQINNRSVVFSEHRRQRVGLRICADLPTATH